MAFTGTATVKSLGKHVARITGLSLASGAGGTVGLPGDSGADVQLPTGFPAEVDASAALAGLTMSDLVQAYYVNDGESGGNESRHVHVVKDDGPPFRITYSNDHGSQATSALEIWVQYWHSTTR